VKTRVDLNEGEMISPARQIRNCVRIQRGRIKFYHRAAAAIAYNNIIHIHQRRQGAMTLVNNNSQPAARPPASPEFTHSH